jgi:hypothetical protein
MTHPDCRMSQVPFSPAVLLVIGSDQLNEVTVGQTDMHELTNE